MEQICPPLFLPTFPIHARPSRPTLLSSSSSSSSFSSSHRSPVNVPRRRRRRPRQSFITVPIKASGVTSEASSKTTGKLDLILQPRDKIRYILFGGKGGVGKTSVSASSALRCAENGLNTLLISTDPAHSLGDALQMDLSHGRITRVDETLPLYAVESDPKEAVDRFRTLIRSLGNTDETNDDPDTSSSTKTTNNNNNKSTDKSGGGNNSAASRWVNKLGLNELSDVLQTIPPGADELIALSAVLDVTGNNDSDEISSMGIDRGDSHGVVFDRVIIDTAPTGHTLRMLTLPDFLDGVLGQALRVREKLTKGSANVVARVLVGREREEIDEAARRVAKYREKMASLSDLLRDPSRTEFVVVSIATALAVAETQRLVDKLWDDGLWVRHIVVNQLIPQPIPDSYVRRVRSAQAHHIAFATEVLADEYNVNISTVPRFDADVSGILALQALARVAYREQVQMNYGQLFSLDKETQHSNGNNDEETCQFVFIGGKGGVGKTSMSAAMAISLAQQGYKTLVLSTDPAHSLGDALQMDISGGDVQPVTSLDSINEDLPLYALEIDAAAAVTEFQNAARAYVRGDTNAGGVGVDMARRLGLDEFANLLDNAPPGIDEVVALTRVIDLVQFGDFQRVIVDTAPTGHTLRLLSLPDFLDSFLGKISALKQKFDRSLAALKSILGGGGGGGGNEDGNNGKSVEENVRGAEKNIENFRGNMSKLRDIIRDKSITQFVVVTVPTALAMAESERLVRTLVQDQVNVKNVVINQVVPDGTTDAYARRVVAQQNECMIKIEDKCSERKITLIEVPYFDAEVRGIYGLRAMGVTLFSPESSDSETAD